LLRQFALSGSCAGLAPEKKRFGFIMEIEIKKIRVICVFALANQFDPRAILLKFDMEKM
jgi:hypothetical protein